MLPNRAGHLRPHRGLRQVGSAAALVGMAARVVGTYTAEHASLSTRSGLLEAAPTSAVPPDN